MAMAWRLLVTEPLDGATNMAIDEALLRSRIAGHAPPTVRFYGWVASTVSLGYAQLVEDGIDWQVCARLRIDRVRRPTGGSAILHEPPEREVTYSVVARADDFAGADDVLETYRVIGSGLAGGLSRLGVPAEVVSMTRGRSRAAAPAFCFGRTGVYEIAVGGKKLCGSAQRRQAGAFLQHGSVLLAADGARLRAVFPGSPDPEAELTTLAAALGRPVAFDEIVNCLTAGLSDALRAPLAPGGLSAHEAELADRLVVDKYRSETWTMRGQSAVPMGMEHARSPRA